MAKQTFQVMNVKCSGCASTLKSRLLEEFGEIDVNLETEPREITLDIEEKQMRVLKTALKKLGYPMMGEEMNFVETNTLKAKSFVSCAIGKMNT